MIHNKKSVEETIPALVWPPTPLTHIGHSSVLSALQPQGHRFPISTIPKSDKSISVPKYDHTRNQRDVHTNINIINALMCDLISFMCQTPKITWEGVFRLSGKSMLERIPASAPLLQVVTPGSHHKEESRASSKKAMIKAFLALHPLLLTITFNFG